MARVSLQFFKRASLAGALLCLTSCSGDTDGGAAGDEDFSGEQFVPGETNAGSMNISLNQQEIAVGDVAGFTVTVKDANGAGVSNIKVSCDTEQHLALIEPSTGTEMTNSSGLMSGRVGCERPGSFQMGCRLPVGGNRRVFAGIKCTGDIPQGFSGFPGAGGGGLGGGVSGTDDDINGGSTNAVRILSVSAFDSGTFGADETATPSIDTIQGACGTGTAATPEPFFDTMLGVKIQNNTSSIIRFESMSYSIDNADGGGTQFNSKRISFTQESEATVGGDGETSTLFALAFRGNSGRKFYADSTFPIPASLGFRNVTVRLVGRTSDGEEVRINARTGLSFGNFDRCAG